MGFLDDVVYGILLLVSLFAGHYIKSKHDSKQKQWLSSGIGFLMVIFVCRLDFLHSVTLVLINWMIIRYLDSRKCHLVSFAWCFGYIVFFRTTHFFGLPKVIPHANAVQLLLTLKMVGLAFEVHDTNNLKMSAESPNADTKSKLKYEYQKIDPSFTDVILYSYCYIGLLTGPYFKFRTYYDMINNANTANIDTYRPTISKLQRIPLYTFGYLLGTYYFDVQYAVSEECFARPFWYRFMYMVMCFVVMRARFYIAWILSECICMTTGLGAYPVNSRPRCGQGPTDFEKLKETESIAPNAVVYNFETIRNIDEYGCDFSTTVREGMRHWNMSVQYWLAHHVYKRLTLKNSQIKVAITMLVSAFWHGIHPGYYLSFLTIPLCLLAEDLILAAFHKGAPLRQQKRVEWFVWFVKMRAFDYMSMGFMLLTFESTIGYWSSIYFAVHVWTFCLIVIGLICRPKRSKSKEYVSNTTLQDENQIKKDS